MGSPIEVLTGNIIHAFENANPLSLNAHLNATESGLIARQIDYDNGCDKVKTTHAKKESREIYLQETYLSYLWSLIYSILVMYEEGVQKPLINNQFTGVIDSSNPLLYRARCLYEWAISLPTEYSHWDEQLPNPRNHLNDKERFYAERANGIYQDAVAYNLFHEFAHLTLGHDAYFDETPPIDMTESQKADRIQIENEADSFAFNMLIDSGAPDRERLAKGLAVIIANIGSLLVVNSPSNLSQSTHPDLDDRLHRALMSLNLEEEINQFYGWYLGCLAIRLFVIKHGLEEEPKEYETAQEAFAAHLELFDKLKGSVIV